MSTMPIPYPACDTEIRSSKGDNWIETLEDGVQVQMLPICFQDSESENSFISQLSTPTRHFRFLGVKDEASFDRFDQLATAEYYKGVAFVALTCDGGEPRKVGMSHYKTSESSDCCECIATVSDDWHAQSLASMFIRNLMDLARSNGFKRLFSIALTEDTWIFDLAKHLGFQKTIDPCDDSRHLYVADL
jgi:hypothetical protein